MTGNIQRWPDPDSRNERLVDARSAELALELAAELPASTDPARPATQRARWPAAPPPVAAPPPGPGRCGLRSCGHTGHGGRHRDHPG
jgi:hypothetical protein